MTINVIRDFELVTLEISGILDATTSPNLDNIISELPADTKELVFDMSGVDYISSAGIDVLHKAYLKFSPLCCVRILGLNAESKETFKSFDLLYE